MAFSFLFSTAAPTLLQRVGAAVLPLAVRGCTLTGAATLFGTVVVGVNRALQNGLQGQPFGVDLLMAVTVDPLILPIRIAGRMGEAAARSTLATVDLATKVRENAKAEKAKAFTDAEAERLDAVADRVFTRMRDHFAAGAPTPAP